jgi:tryptophan-rich sensory protein
MTLTQGARSKPILAAALSALAMGVLGALMTDLSTWYFMLRKPSWQPPDWLFGPVWTLIFALAALAGVVYWRRTPERERRLRVLAAFAINAFLNTLWSLLFFRLRRPDLALYEVGFLWLSIIALILLLYRESQAAGWLLVPYLVWVSFAAYLNLAIVRLNAPFQ